MKELIEKYKKMLGQKDGYCLIAFGPVEIVLIVAAVGLLFGIPKIAQLGKAAGKSIGDFRREVRKSKLEQQEENLSLGIPSVSEAETKD